ncbi:6-phosphogluconolactonase [Gracilibacillus ureilyticus]|uniref:6-phosphogluconolactonase n=1 Tax=Gracilibacillus ureilyticus TaxID=531814 RepID=A0A1H9TNT4_9BACI|nr:lactonase family protein [Gracilibacillus ureilyticus]SER98664.1 6-phosphogluconolactonase [Gracilibacillus ureilyticus]
MANKRYIGYVGTYTKKTSKGVYRFELDLDKKELNNVQVATELDNPTYVTVSKNNKFLYAVSKEGDQGGVTSFSISETGELKKLNSKASAGSPPCHVSVNSDNSLVVAANYHTKLVEAYTTETDGSLIETASAEHNGSGPHQRQEKPHLHYAGFTPDEKYVVVVDLGTDTVTSYQYTEGKLEEVAVLQTQAGSGPRHLVFHPNGEYAYVMTELSNEVISLRYKGEGKFEEIQYLSAIPEDFTENSQGSAIHISSDGKFVYAGNRGHNSIAVYKVEDDFTLSFVAWTDTEGDWPRDFVLDPSEQFVIASNQESDTLVLFERDKENGTLTLIQKDVKVPEPVCVKFLNQ